MLIAYRRWRDRADVSLEDDPAKLRWAKESWTTGRFFGERKSHVSRSRKEGPLIAHDQPYDVRIVSSDDEKTIRSLEDTIRNLQNELAAFKRDRFLTWRLVTPDDCSAVVPGSTKAEATAKLRAETNISDDRLKHERDVVRTINRALR